MHPAFGTDFDRMVSEGFGDLADRQHTGSMGGFSRAIGRGGVFMFMNLQGSRIEAEVIVHEMGHAFALIESCKLPYMMQWAFPTDFSETPSSVMEMLSMPYWDEYYAKADLPQAYNEYMLDTLRSSIEETIADALYHWVYANLEEAKDAAKCAEKWLKLHERYFPEVDYTGLEIQFGNQWQSMMLNFHYPFFAMEYVYGRVVGLNLLGLVLEKPEVAIAKYRHALSLGSSVSTKDLFTALDTHFPLSREDVVSALRVAKSYI
jgi:oligoendopeptidase F